MFETISQLVASHHYLALGGILFISAMGVPIPEEPVLLAGGLAVGWDKADYVTTVLVCILGVIGGDLYIYYLGRNWGVRFLKTRLGRFTFPEHRQARIRQMYEKHGNKTVFFGRFIPAVRFGVFFFAGQLRMNVLRFTLLNLSGGLFNISIVVALGSYAARKFIDPVKARAFAQHIVHEYQFYFFLTLAIIIAGIIAYGFWKRKRTTPSV